MRSGGYTEAAQATGLKQSTLRSMVHHKKVPHIRVGPRTVVFDLDELEAWLKAKAVKP
jgi:excisionase family DNA binding protein